MQLDFRRLPSNEAPAPAPGEIWVTPTVVEYDKGTGVAELALSKGLVAFPQGEGPMDRIVLQDDPTLDDMLAAALVERLVEGRSLPKGIERFTTYAGLAREGLKPTDLPLKDSLEGIYLAVRYEAGADLAQPQAKEQFLADWSQVCKVIFDAAEAGRNPISERLFTDNPAFARLRTFLDRDRDVYSCRDVPAGERWRVEIGGGAGEQGGLLLRNPKSMLWKYWAREDAEAPGGKGYLFLAAREEGRPWILSTDPVHRLPITPLADKLQAAELAKNPIRAARDPWYDGRRHGHTLIGGPWGGSALSEPEILAIVKDWTQAQAVRDGIPASPRIASPWWTRASVVAVVVGVIGIGFAILPWSSSWGGRGIEWIRIADDDDSPTQATTTGKSYALLISTDHYDAHPKWRNLGNAIDDAKAIRDELKNYCFEELELIEDPECNDMKIALEKWCTRKYDPPDQLFIFIAGHGDFSSAKKGYLVAKNSIFRDLARRDYLSLADLKDFVEKAGCNHIFLVMDCCYSGTIDFGTAVGESRGGPAPEGIYQPVSRDEFIHRKMKRRTCRCLTSGGREPVPDGVKGQHSPFAAKFLEALQSGGGKHGVLTATKIKETVDDVERCEPMIHRLHRDDPNGDFLFIKKE